MENIKTNIFSLLGIILFFIPLKINNEYETIVYHLSYFIENKVQLLIYISLIFFLLLSIFNEIIKNKDIGINKLTVFTKVFSLCILIFVFLGKGDIFLKNKEIILIFKDVLFNLTILLPLSSIFMPLLLEYGILEFVEAFTHKVMKILFKVSGKILFNFLIYIFVNNICGAFVTYKLYKDGKLKEKEMIITILNFSILSISLTNDLCSKINFNKTKFLFLEIIVLILCNLVICRVYPIKYKKQSYFFKSDYKNVNYKRNKLKKAKEIYYKNKSEKNIFQLSISYLNEVIYILMDLIPIMTIVFFLFSIIYNLSFFLELINTFISLFVSIFNINDSYVVSNIFNFNFFCNIFAIESIPKTLNYIDKVRIALIICLQCINIYFLIPFIKSFKINLNLKEIIIVAMERFFIINFICFIFIKFI